MFLPKNLFFLTSFNQIDEVKQYQIIERKRRKKYYFVRSKTNCTTFAILMV